MTPADILVILPTLGDRLETLRETLESVTAQRPDVRLRLVVVAPRDATDARALAESYGAEVVDDPKRGISHAINQGIAMRREEQYYAWVGDDDLFREGGLLRLKQLLDAQSDAVVAFGGCDYIDPDGRLIATSNAGRLALLLLPWGPDLVPHPGSMIRLSALADIGNFDTSLRFAMDLDAFLKLRRIGRFIWTRETVSAFRWHPQSLTVANRSRSGEEAERVKRAHLPAFLRPFSPVWHLPVRWASAVAAAQVSRRALALANRAP